MTTIHLLWFQKSIIITKHVPAYCIHAHTLVGMYLNEASLVEVLQ